MAARFARLFPAPVECRDERRPPLLLNSSTTRSARPWPRRWPLTGPRRRRLGQDPRAGAPDRRLIQVEHASPYSILSVTFTNKAAAEMRHRIEQLLGINPGMWVGTFHGLAHRLLRAHWREAGLSENFQILDSDDQQRLVKRVIRELGLDEQRWPARQAQWFINGQKGRGPAAATSSPAATCSSPPC